MDIVACTDTKFIMPTGVMMYSVCYNNDLPIVFHIIIDASVTERNKKDLEGTIAAFSHKQVLFYLMDPQKLSRIPAMGEFRQDLTRATYYRLWLAELLPESINRVLYLDGDIIVRHSLLPLWDIDLNGHAIAAAPDKNENDTKANSKYQRLNYSPSLGYFNAGVLLINLDFWRKRNVVRDFLEMMEERPQSLNSHDQDVLNYCFRDKKLHLPIKYNTQDGYLYVIPGYDYNKYEQEVIEARKDPVVVHFTNDKPWWTYNRHPHPWRSLFFKYQSQTIWKGAPLWEMRPWHIRLRKHVATILRRWGLLPELPPNGGEYIEINPIN